MSRLRHVVEGIPLLLFALATASPVIAADSSIRRSADSPIRIVLVLIDRIDFPDLLDADAPALKALMRKGAVGLISPLMRGRICSANAVLTLVMGTPAGNDDGSIVLEREFSLLDPLHAVARVVSSWDLHELQLDEFAATIPSTIALATTTPINVYTSSRWIQFRPTPLSAQQRQRRLAVLEAFAAGANLDDNVYIFAVLTSRQPKRYFPRLTPVIVAGRGVKAGLLTTATTRQLGLVTLTDVKPTVFSLLGIWTRMWPKEMTGRAMTVTPSSDPIATLKHLDQWTMHRDKVAVPVVTLIGVLQGFSGLLAIPLLFLSRRAIVGCLAPFAQFLLLAGLATPLAALIASPFVTRGLFFTLATMTFVSLAVGGGLLAVLRCEVKSLVVLCAAVALTILFDALRGGPWTTWSIMGNAFTTGGRFYGIENGHAAYLVAFAIVALGLFPASRWTIAGACVVPLALGVRWFGANFGGAVMASAALWTLVLCSRGIRNRWSAVLFVVAMTAATSAVVVGSELMLKDGMRTHIGLAFDRAIFENPKILGEMAVRKWRANLDYIRFTPFNYVLLAGALILVALVWQPPQLARQLFARRPSFRAALVGGLIGLWVAFFTNDSGIAMLDQMVQVLAPALVLMLLNEKTRDDGLRLGCGNRHLASKS